MSSDEEEVPSPVTGASSSKEQPPLLPSDSESRQDELTEKAKQETLQASIQWLKVLRFSKGDDTIIGEDEMKLQILQAHKKIMESLILVQLPGHMPGQTDVGMWKLKSEDTIDGRQTVVKWCQCPMAYRFGCKIQIKLYDDPAYTNQIV